MAARKGKKVVSVVVGSGLVAGKGVDYGDRRFGLFLLSQQSKLYKIIN
jgi:hypothetical protein